jgi:ATP-dependent Clp protease protease subunit
MTDIASSGKLDDEIERTLLHNRRVFYADGVTQESATEAIRKLWYLELRDPGKPITLVINSPGGSVDAGFAVWDQIEMLTSPVSTLVTGIAASMGSILAQVASKGRRFATPNSRILIHQPAIHGTIQGQAADLEIQAREIIKTRQRIVELYARKTGKDETTIANAIERDTWFTADEAKDYGLVDAIVNSYSDIS